VAVLFLDLDGFKDVNDNNGHEAGDRLLVAVSRRLQASLRPEDTIARLGGDEFTVLIEDLDDTRFVNRVAERITESLKTPFLINGAEASITASIGIALSTGLETTPEELLNHADTAMYEAKRAGKARAVVYSGTETQSPNDEASHLGVEDAVVVEESYEDAAAEPDEVAVEDEAAEQNEVAELDEIEAEDEVAMEDEVAVEEPNPNGSEAPREQHEPEQHEPEAQEPFLTTPSRKSLSEARRRRRLRFPPRLG